MHTDMPLFRSSPSLWEVLQENQSNLQFDPQLLGSWMWYIEQYHNYLVIQNTGTCTETNFIQHAIDVKGVSCK